MQIFIHTYQLKIFFQGNYFYRIENDIYLNFLIIIHNFRYIEGDISHTAARKHVSYILGKEFGNNKIHLLSSIEKHPYWKSIPLLRINGTIKYLKEYFSIEDICKNIQIVLYPR